MVGDKDVVAPRPQTSALPDLGTCLQMTKMETFTEVMHQVNKTKFCQQVGNELAAWILGLIQFPIDIYQ